MPTQQVEDGLLCKGDKMEVMTNRKWVDYENGFSSLTREYWYGLRAINCLTIQGAWQTCIDYTLISGTKGHLRIISSQEERPNIDFTILP